MNDHSPPPLRSCRQLHGLGLDQAKDCLNLDQLALNGLWTEQQWRRELNDPKRLCLGISESCQLLAMACGWPVADELQLTVVAVHPQHRQQGLGQQLLRALLKQARGGGACLATLEVASSNDAARSLYKSCGFETTGCRRRYYRDGRDALIQSKRLDRNDHCKDNN